MILNDLKQCKKHDDCFANDNGLCKILYETEFESCPFYKVKKKDKRSRQRMNRKLGKMK